METKLIHINDSVFIYKHKFVQRVKEKNGKQTLLVFNKFKNGGPRDFLYSTTNLKTLISLCAFFEEEISFPVLPEMHPDYDKS